MNTYDKLTAIFNNMTKHRFPYNEMEIKKNGIYIMFENGERHNEFDRVVRIGSHTGVNRLLERIDEHYIGNDHRDSIFRKHLGRCFLTLYKKTDYIKTWDLKIKKREDKVKHIDKIDWNIEQIIEDKITSYIKDNFSFIVIPNLTDETKRLRLEAGLIAIFAQFDNKQISETWIGRCHPDVKILKSGLWNIHDINNKPLNDEEINYIIDKMNR